MRTTWDSPGTRLGLWSHFTSQFGMTVFTLLWGFPFLVRGDRASARRPPGVLLVLMTATQILVGPVLGAFVARHPYQRSHLVLLVVGAIATVWAVVLIGPVPPHCRCWSSSSSSPRWADPRRWSGSTWPARSTRAKDRQRLGVVNVGGFVASLSAMALVGIVLDQVTPGGPTAYTRRVPPGDGRPVPVLGSGSAADLAVPAQGDPTCALTIPRRYGRSATATCSSGHLPLAADGGPGAPCGGARRHVRGSAPPRPAVVPIGTARPRLRRRQGRNLRSVDSIRLPTGSNANRPRAEPRVATIGAVDAAGWDRYDASDLVWSATPNAVVARETADRHPGGRWTWPPGRAQRDLARGTRLAGHRRRLRPSRPRAPAAWPRNGSASADRVDAVTADLMSWSPPPASADLTVLAFLRLASA